MAQTPHGFLCPISKGVMFDPVIASDGRNYDRKSIEEWIRTCNSNVTSPITRERMSTTLFDNRELKERVMEWMESKDKRNKRSLEDTREDLKRMAESLCFMENEEKRKNRLELLMSLMKEHDLPFEETFANRFCEKYEGGESQKNEFLQQNQMLLDKRANKMRVADAVQVFTKRNENRLRNLQADTELKMVKCEEALENLRKKMRRLIETSEAQRRLSDKYDVDTEEGSCTSHKKMKLLTTTDAKDYAYTEKNLQTARGMILKAMERYPFDEWEYMFLMDASRHLGHPLATLISSILGEINVEGCVDKLEAYVRDIPDKELALVAKHHIAEYKNKGPTDAERAEAIAMLIENAEAGYTPSMVSLSLLGPTANEKKEWAAKAFAAGHAAGGMCMALACHSTENKFPFIQDDELWRLAISWMKLSADAGVTRAQYWSGRYVQVDMAKHGINSGDAFDERDKLARRMFQLAAEKGHCAAMFEHGRYLLNDSKEEERPEIRASLADKGIHWLQRSEDRGYKFANEYLSTLSTNCKTSMQ